MKFNGALFLAAALLVAPAAANAHQHARHHRHHGKSLSAQDRARFDHSGTRGRMASAPTRGGSRGPATSLRPVRALS
ncbi:hypothetical protein SAMN05444581_11530 [Methylocapsa palsarum]|uniref:Uncharacterized protein n=1 Tax=Methylocapsa palsarum TaxID=1612308 RepID=A0A1I4BL90_9HYPH|nr:hypothetical protein SAMN05444581_11530 [Methylocapsa palsarum]